MKIKIAIQDRSKAEEYERMNIPDNAPIEWVDFYFKLELLESMWVDPTDSMIVIGINGDDYRTPYNDRLFNVFMKAFNAD